MAKHFPRLAKDPHLSSLVQQGLISLEGLDAYPEHWACDYCPTIFKTKAKADAHEKRKHPKLRNFMKGR